MNSYQIKIIDDVTVEPVTLEEIKARLGIDADYAANDLDLLLIAAAAREKLEQFTSLGFAPRKIQVLFTSGLHELPLGPTITEKSEIEVTDIDNEVVLATDYSFKGLTFIMVLLHHAYGENNIFYPISGGAPIFEESVFLEKEYLVTYQTGYEILPNGLKSALLTQIDYDYKARGSDQMEPLSPVALQKCAGYSRNLFIQ